MSVEISNKIQEQAKKAPRKRFSQTHTEYVHRVDWNRFRPSRAGVIVYTFFQGKVYFGLGVDRRFQELTDFGGGIRYTKDKNAVVGALREFMEESLYSFGFLSCESVQNSIVTYSSQMAVLFVYLHVDPSSVSLLFRERVETIDNPEVSDIVWLSSEEFTETVRRGWTRNNTKMYKRVQNLLRGSTILRDGFGKK